MSVFVKPLMDWFMFGMVIETGPKFYMVPFPTQKVLWYMFYIFSFFAKPSMYFIQLWRDDRALSKILCSTIPIPVHDLKIKVTDFEFFCVKSSQCQLLQNLWLIWIMFGMNGYKILKCFRKEKRVSGELPCPATGLISFVVETEYWLRNFFSLIAWCYFICDFSILGYSCIYSTSPQASDKTFWFWRRFQAKL